MAPPLAGPGLLPVARFAGCRRPVRDRLEADFAALVHPAEICSNVNRECAQCGAEDLKKRELEGQLLASRCMEVPLSPRLGPFRNANSRFGSEIRVTGIESGIESECFGWVGRTFVIRSVGGRRTGGAACYIAAARCRSHSLRVVNVLKPALEFSMRLVDGR